jgi:hypothetical protein
MLPGLESGKDYVALVVMENVAARDSLSLNKGTSIIVVKSPIRFFDLKIFADQDFTNKLASDFKACNPSQTCSPSGLFNPQVISKDAFVQFDKYWV